MKNIIILPSVVLTPTIERCAEAVDPYLDGLSVTMTSGKRMREAQLRIIIEKVKKHGIDKLYPEFNLCIENPVDFKIKIDDQEFYYWQRPWSKLLNIGEIVNPPIPAEVLLDYFRPGSTVNGKGRVIGISNHMKGNSFDLSGENLKAIAQKVADAKIGCKAFVAGYLLEDVNNAVHVDCVPV